MNTFACWYVENMIILDPYQNKDNTSYEVEADVEPLILQSFGDLQALLEDSDDDLKDVSDEEMYEKLAAFYADHGAAVEEYAEENKEHRNQTDKAINSVMERVEKINKARVDERTTNTMSETLEAESSLKATKQTMVETNTTTSSNITRGNFKKQVVVWQKPPSYTKGEPQPMVTKEKNHEVTKVIKDPEHEPQDTETILITIVGSTSMTIPEAEITESSLRPQLIVPILKVPTPK
nr:hypothetical protein [Tanacetum cinerariifolium]